jgi:hypothetical protein
VPIVLRFFSLQAAGRLRQLGRGQQLLIMGLPAVTDKIRAAAAAKAAAAATGHQLPGSSSSSVGEPSVLQLLQWTMDNTVRGSQAGVAEWASQGCHFAATTGAPDRALQDEKLQLDELYGSSRAPEPVGEVLTGIAARSKALCGSSRGDKVMSPGVLSRVEVIEQITQKGSQLGQGYSVIACGGLSEEVERELQEEEEQEEEVEVQPPLVTPAEERDWRYGAVLQPGVTTVQQLCRAARSALQVVPLSKVPGLLLDAVPLADISWSCKVYCSVNFICSTAASQQRLRSSSSSSSSGGGGGSTVQHAAVGSGGSLDAYLRPVDALLLFPSSGEVLLLSEREADALQDLLWRFGSSSSSSSSSGSPVLLSLAYARLAAADGLIPAAAAAAAGQQQMRLISSVSHTAPACQVNWPRHSSLNSDRVNELQLQTAELVSLLLFNGSASYGSEVQREQLRQVMRGKRGAAEVLLSLRGKAALLARSDLELACDDV